MDRPRPGELTRAALLDKLPEPALDLDDDAAAAGVRRYELRRSILTIAELDHGSEIRIVRAAADRLGRAAEAEEGV
ncbi:hypothetical protein [Virgisporangium aurantiacum]|uniref:Uncharacterized protein n=1 Tax=Virgisporangium aurantiacum TaxID=175570 RepID=A0A8J3ZES1_9ACTN|nr:hypothetical protein [Virgisporangium aurantiacum]GIJ60305.1 hypothetical protein Vau01_078210 [Virgisporangium aurantiacum]